MRCFMETVHVILFIVCLLCGCSGGGIPREKYSALETPQQTVEFAKKAVAKDDPTAFYYCLAQGTQKQISLSDLKFGWALAGNFFYLFLEAKLDSAQIPAPEKMFYGNPNTAKVIMKTNDLNAAFLLHRESHKWKLLYPSPYPLPNINKLKKRGRLPWRNQEYAFYQSSPRQWFKPAQIKRRNQRIIPPRKPYWRQ